MDRKLVYIFKTTHKYVLNYFSKINGNDIVFFLFSVPDVVAPFHVVKGETELQVKPLSFCSYTSRPLQFLVYYKETRTDILSGDKSESHVPTLDTFYISVFEQI